MKQSNEAATPEQWVSKEKGAEILGLQSRQFLRRVQDGFIRKQATGPYSNSPCVYSLEDIQKLAGQRENGGVQSRPEPPKTGVVRSSQPNYHLINTMGPAALAAMQEIQHAAALIAQRASDPEHKLWLTLEEASAYSGIPVHWLRKKCKDQSIGINVGNKSHPNWRIKKTDLEAI